jgi:hypothetical protein
VSDRQDDRRGYVRPADRLVIALLAVFNAFAAWRIWYPAPDLPNVPAAPAWPVLFAAAALACVALERRFFSRNLLALAGGLSVTAYTSRALLVVIEWQRGLLPFTRETTQLIAAQWAMLALLTGFIFVRVLRPILEFRRPGLNETP